MTTKHDIRFGTKLAVEERYKYSRTYPQVSYSIYSVHRVTDTQALASGDGGEIRIRISDLKVIGGGYTRAVIATEEILATHKAEADERRRFIAAVRLSEDLIGRPLHQLKLNTAQMEALAKAWADIKAMA